MAIPGMTELRVEILTEDMAVLDGYVAASGTNRAEIIRIILKAWSDIKLRESEYICRFAGVNPITKDSAGNHDDKEFNRP